MLYTLGKISTRAVPMPEGTMDLRSQGMRSKLLALHLILTILTSYSYVFLTPCSNLLNQNSASESTIFIDYAKEHLCLCISRNAISVVPPVLEVAIDIFGKLMINLWPYLKKEIAVIFTEIVLPLIEAKKQFSFFQRITMIKGLNRLLSDPKNDGGKLLVELYLNYDCDVESGARENIWEHLASALGKAISQHGESSSSNYSHISSFAHSSTARDLTPEMTTSNLTTFTREQVKDLYSLTGNVEEFRKCGNDLIVNGILKPLSTYCQNRIKSQTTPVEIEVRAVSTNSNDAINELEKKNIPAVGDDPAAFEGLKQQKKALIEGVKLFNQKPKNVFLLNLISGYQIPYRCGLYS